ncbi:C40 family peptidase [uncultured Jatrophihabitans sp.]|uniref:C40 family peptidase n=1 Tax=uncultured Jatrophihabitans sp. TaxID=1610747 RepID=UPI0035C943CA
MAFRFARPSKAVPTLAAIIGIAGALAIAPTVAGAAPQQKPHTPHHQPSKATVQRELGKLAIRNSQLVEQFNQARITVAQAEKTAGVAHAAALRAQAASDTAHEQFVQMIQAQYEGQNLGATSALLDSNSGSNYLSRLTAQNMVSEHEATVISGVTRARKAAVAADAKAKGDVATATARRDALGKKRDAVEAQLAKYRATLEKLSAAQRAALKNGKTENKSVATTLLTSGSESAAAQRAVKFALAQVGKPYVWGSGGPSSYDCSGLTMASWRHGGVSLPHSAAGQYGHGHHVAQSALIPGDLIFFYHPIGHVTIYIGNGLMVSAPTEGENVQVVPLHNFQSDYAGATRVG